MLENKNHLPSRQFNLQMNQLNLSDVCAFRKVVTTFSFAEAARQLGSSRSKISKKIARLERNLGVTLINRTARCFGITEAGRTFHQYTAQVDTVIKHAADVVRGTDLQSVDTVAFSIPPSLGSALLASLTSKFEASWPNVNYSMHFEERTVDFMPCRHDFSIQVLPKLVGSSLICQKLGSTRKILAASPGYLRKFGKPACIEDLKQHRCLGYGSATKCSATWRFQGSHRQVEIPCTFSVSANNEMALILAACLDNGIVYLPEAFISNELAQGSLLTVLPQAYTPATYEVVAVYPDLNAARQVEALVAFIEKELSSLSVSNRWTHLAGSFDCGEKRNANSISNISQVRRP